MESIREVLDKFLAKFTQLGFNGVSRKVRTLLRITALWTVFVCGLIVVSKFEKEVDGPNNNYGIDCNLVDRYLSGDSDDMPPVADLQIEVEIFVKDQGGYQSTIKQRPLYNCMVADNDYLVEKLKSDYLVPPAAASLPYNFDPPYTEFNQNPQALDVYEMVFKDNVKNGFFIEAGAMDCQYSPTAPFEVQLGWTGLLVEVLPTFFEKCKKTNRKASLINTCVGTKDKPHFIDIDTLSAGKIDSKEDGGKEAVMAGIAGEMQKHSAQTINMQCFPLYSLLSAMGNPTVNLLVLDIEGFELAVLRTIPWKKVDIEVFTIETDLAGKFMKGSRDDIISLMAEAGYQRFDHRDDFNPKTGQNQNDMFVRKDIVKKYNVVQLK